MSVSRLTFLSAVAAAPLGRLVAPMETEPARPCARCVLSESRAGFARAMTGEEPGGVFVVPAACGWDGSVPWRVRSGQVVIFESAGGFGDEGERAEQRRGLERAFDLRIGEPIALWEDGRRPSYVEYEWPVPARVRDFSVVTPVRGGRTIGRVDGVDVAALVRVGEGALVFIGSPLGPGLWTGETEALSWLAAVRVAALGGCRRASATPAPAFEVA